MEFQIDCPMPTSLCAGPRDLPRFSEQDLDFRGSPTDVFEGTHQKERLAVSAVTSVLDHAHSGTLCRNHDVDHSPASGDSNDGPILAGYLAS